MIWKKTTKKIQPDKGCWLQRKLILSGWLCKAEFLKAPPGVLLGQASQYSELNKSPHTKMLKPFDLQLLLFPLHLLPWLHCSFFRFASEAVKVWFAAVFGGKSMSNCLDTTTLSLMEAQSASCPQFQKLGLIVGSPKLQRTLQSEISFYLIVCLCVWVTNSESIFFQPLWEKEQLSTGEPSLLLHGYFLFLKMCHNCSNTYITF